MSYMSCIGICAGCQKRFSFNPELVPSIRLRNGRADPSGAREPVCGNCVERANVKRRANGLAEIVPLAGAYDPEVVA